MKSVMMKKLGKAFVLGGVLFSVALPAMASAPSGSIGALAEQMISSLQGIQDVLISVCYIAGVGFAGAGIFKFKQHKDNPTQVPLGGPIAMIFIAAALIYLPSVIVATGTTIFGSSGQYGKIGTGQEIFGT